ncbi:MAG: hypothetical protein V9H69_01050 [Anaerolineae bacterium]
MPDTLIYPNGIDAETGAPLLPPLPVELVAGLAQGRPIAKAELDELRARVVELEKQRTAHLGVIAGIDPNDLAQAGWGVIFASEDEAELPALREALAPLLELRRGQAGERYRDERVDPKFLYLPGESMNAWRSRNGGAPGKVDPRRLPYYLLIVGDPQRIPFDFQYQLDVAHAVGRIHFDTLDEYHSYARSVAAAESPSQPLALARSAAFFGVRNQFDMATQLSVQHLVSPLADALSPQLAGWQVQRWLEGAASKTQLGRLLGGDSTPAFLFSASHGLGFQYSGNGNPRQRAEQGALICSDWPGAGPVQRDMQLCAEDIGNDASLLGLIAFFFACFGAGTPQYDDFAIGDADEGDAGQPSAGEWAGAARPRPHRAARLCGEAAAAPAGPSQRGRAGRGGPRGPGLGQLLHLGRRAATGYLRERADPAAGRRAAGRGHRGLQQPLRRALHRADSPHPGRQIPRDRAAGGAGRAVDRQQRRPQLRHPGRPGRQAGRGRQRRGGPAATADREHHPVSRGRAGRGEQIGSRSAGRAPGSAPGHARGAGTPGGRGGGAEGRVGPGVKSVRRPPVAAPDSIANRRSPS